MSFALNPDAVIERAELSGTFVPTEPPGIGCVREAAAHIISLESDPASECLPNWETVRAIAQLFIDEEG